MPTISYVILDVEAGAIYFDLERRSRFYASPSSPAGVQSCPAVKLLQGSSFVVRCPIDLRLHASMVDDDLQIHIVPPDTSISANKLRNMLLISPRDQWRNRRAPVLQISTPYVFYSKSPCLLNQRHPTEFPIERLSWRLIEGAYAIHKWVRPLSWAVEWADLSRDIILRRGEPWFAVDFCGGDVEAPMRVSKEGVTDWLREELLRSRDVSAYVRGTFSLQRAPSDG